MSRADDENRERSDEGERRPSTHSRPTFGGPRSRSHRDHWRNNRRHCARADSSSWGHAPGGASGGRLGRGAFADVDDRVGQEPTDMVVRQSVVDDPPDLAAGHRVAIAQ